MKLIIDYLLFVMPWAMAYYAVMIIGDAIRDGSNKDDLPSP